MGSLRDQLLNAGLVSKKQTGHAERQARKKRKKKRKGGGADPEELARRGALEEQARKQAEAQARRVEEQRHEREAHERKVQVANLLGRPSTLDTRPGRRRWYFATREGRISWLLVTSPTASALVHGRAGIAERPLGRGDRYELVEARTLDRIRSVDSEWIRFWNGHPDHAGLPTGHGELLEEGEESAGDERAGVAS